MQLIPTPTPKILSADELKERQKLMAQLFVSGNSVGMSSREVIGLRSMQQEYRGELGHKQGRKLYKSMLD
ncbi:hypothetical protein PC129_g18731 [Phytophthora cactorum]|uniref:Uncharacterized protein n=1 Tax=Phytophthora cactorum TaxID=29920 RepID=A0A329RNC3_9STRA|nr:hypothetical protein Pcac1_g26544 [Phytophthora cactorum]KAG2801739.1 hypothetical protein PC112_g19914 [Phytophthora cactorum]KAG2810980.1 hypothetical protein PC111_g15423 [Phytophthora cactorum]KAG2850328.1 hypothetical protein PC113_g16882 [Phytophthora cactorum]KAG2903917.1 hypothetical protein PC114_g12059 [Phytophthora cactorum]